MNDKELIFERFPRNVPIGGELKADRANPAIRLYGRRFYKDQTPIEYLAEFLLAFASPKLKNGDGAFQFSVFTESDEQEPCYYPEDRVALKLFSFFPTSKLETRHPVHRSAYMDALQKIESIMGDGCPNEKQKAVRLLQSLLNGFVGVSSNRTWVTQCFLPVSNSLLSREVNWEHVRAGRGRQGAVVDWDSSRMYFSDNLRNFMSRGGEILFLQLVNLFQELENHQFVNLLNMSVYEHLKPRIEGIKQKIEFNLQSIINDSSNNIESIVNIVENTLLDYKIRSTPKASAFGWIPKSSRTEALLFATEIENICSSNMGTLDKLDLLQTLCCMQVMRSLCFQARRVDDSMLPTDGFVGGYVWIVANPNETTTGVARKMAQNSFTFIESMLFRVLRHPDLNSEGVQFSESDFKNGDDNTFRHFSKFAKDLGLVIPRQGQGTRFVLHQGLLRFLVAALIRPGERIRLTHFYQRIFAHYGIAIGGDQLKVALQWLGKEAEGDIYAVTSNTTWVEEALKQGGFLVELSDAVSMVMNPGEE